MSDRELHEFKPDWTLRPGVLLREELKARGCPAPRFAVTAGLPAETVEGILSGTCRIDEAAAHGIGATLGTSAQMWLNAQRIYDDAIARGAKDLSEEHEHDRPGFPPLAYRPQPWPHRLRPHRGRRLGGGTMTGMPPLPRAVLAALAREVVEAHREWDSPHALASVYRDGNGGARYGTVTIIDPALHPDLYPALIAARAAEDAGKQGPPYAFLLQIEGFGTAAPGEDATPADRALFEADRQARTFHLRKDAVEFCTAWVADAHGRMWSATKARDRDGIEEHFYRPGSTALGGQMIKALIAAARDYGSAE